MSSAHPPYSMSQARIKLKEILDRSESGEAVQVRRDSQTSVVVDGQRLRQYFLKTVPCNAEAVREDDAWVVTMPGYPIAVEATDYEDAISELVDALREYAEDWHERLRLAPNHSDNWPMVQLIGLSTDDDLRRWVLGSIE